MRDLRANHASTGTTARRALAFPAPVRRNRREIIRLHHDRLAGLAASSSALRNQGAAGVVRAARAVLRKFNLRRLSQLKAQQFSRRLDRETEALRSRLPRNARNWGTARKVLNIFLRDVLYHNYLCRQYRFDRFESCLEVPLDADVAHGLHGEPEGRTLPKWQGIKHLDSRTSAQYQAVAREVARRRGVAAVHLDLVYWRRAAG